MNFAEPNLVPIFLAHMPSRPSLRVVLRVQGGTIEA
jgi:hypothetical protein